MSEMSTSNRESQPLSPVRKETLSDRVYDRLARALMTGDFEPGASITLRDIARRVDTSVMPVREALWQLTTQQALILKRNKSIQIPLLSDDEFDQLWRLRVLLEGEACAQAARIIPSADVAALSGLLRETLAAVEAQDMRPITIKAHEFFFRIYGASRNPMLVSFIEMLWLRTGPLYFDALSSESHRAFIRKNLRHNTKLFEAMRAGDPAVARAERESDLRELAGWLRTHRTRAGDDVRSAVAIKRSIKVKAKLQRKRA